MLFVVLIMLTKCVFLDPIQLLQRDLNTLHPLLFAHGDDIMNSQLRRLLEELGVKKWTPSDIIQHHILPVFRGDQWKVSHVVINLVHCWPLSGDIISIGFSLED